MMWDINMIDKCCFELKKNTGIHVYFSISFGIQIMVTRSVIKLIIMQP